MGNYYDVTQWPIGNAQEDIGQVINSILEDLKAHQSQTDFHEGGKPGAVIYLPPGDYHLRTQVVIDRSYVKLWARAMALCLPASGIIFPGNSGPVCMRCGREGAVC